jgi:hypothetical protein
MLTWQILGLFLLAAGATGCQTAHAPSRSRLIEHQLPIDFSGLKSTQDIDSLRITCSPPARWYAQPQQKTALYTHEQWKSPTGYTGIGVVYIHLPLPLSAKALIWFAKLEYAKSSKDGKLLDEWTDDLGRPWFEGENAKYHVRGYAVVDGFNAWIVYFGYKVSRPINTAELGLAARCVETVMPLTGDSSPAKSSIADARK